MLSIAIFREDEATGPWVCASKLAVHAVPSGVYYGARTYRALRQWPVTGGKS